jgi:predicted ATPase
VAEVTIALLGGFAAVTGGEPVPETVWRLRKGRELVKLLALARGHRLHREQAMDVLWPDREPRAAANNLNQVVHVARRALGAGAIEVRGELLQLVADVDVDRFERAASDARRSRSPAAYRAALSLYRGELLPENRYDDWAEGRRDELEELHDALTAELDELGPVDGLRGLPLDTSSFVGRERELAELRSLAGRTRLLTLVGAGGSGKTRLALELARQLEPAYRDGAVLAELAPVTDPRSVVDAVAAALDVRALPGRGLVDAVTAFVVPRALLLVLDNCEHVLAASAALVENVLRVAPEATILTTSREPLRLAGELVFRVPSLGIPDPDVPHELGDLVRYESVRLLCERAAATAGGFELDRENAAHVARICFRLDGMPLAIELAAGRFDALGPAEIETRLDDRFRLLRAESGAAPTRQQTLEATLAWSHELLEPDERMLLRRLSVFAGGFDLAAAEAVCATDDLDARDVPHLVARLAEKSLVAVEDAGRERRYRLLETVRLYAHDRAAEAGDAADVARRHADWALALAERELGSLRLDREAANLGAALDSLRADPERALRLCVALWPFWLRRIDLDEAHRRFERALADAPERTPLRAEALLAAGSLDIRAGRLDVAREYALESLSIAEGLGDADREWRALQFLGGIGMSTDDSADAAAWFERARDATRHGGFTAAEALCVYSLGLTRWREGDLHGAHLLVDESIDLFRAAGDSTDRVPTPIGVADNLGGASGGLAHRIVFEDTLQPFVEVTASTAIGHVLANQAGIVREQGDLVGARDILERSGALFRRERDPRGQADVLVRLGHLELADGAPDEGRACLERALDLRRELGDRRGVGMALSGLGLLETAVGNHELAQRHLAEARELFRRAGDRWGLTGALWNSADLAVARGDLHEAEEALDEALDVLREAKRELWVAQTLLHLGETARLRGDDAGAEASWREAREILAARGDERGVADVDERLRARRAKPTQIRPR